MKPDPELDILIEAFLTTQSDASGMVKIPFYRATDDIMADLSRRGIHLRKYPEQTSNCK